MDEKDPTAKIKSVCLGAGRIWKTYDTVRETVHACPKLGVVRVDSMLEKAHAVKDLEDCGYYVSAEYDNDGRFWQIEYIRSKHMNDIKQTKEKISNEN